MKYITIILMCFLLIGGINNRVSNQLPNGSSDDILMYNFQQTSGGVAYDTSKSSDAAIAGGVWFEDFFGESPSAGISLGRGLYMGGNSTWIGTHFYPDARDPQTIMYWVYYRDSLSAGGDNERALMGLWDGVNRYYFGPYDGYFRLGFGDSLVDLLNGEFQSDVYYFICITLTGSQAQLYYGTATDAVEQKGAALNYTASAVSSRGLLLMAYNNRGYDEQPSNGNIYFFKLVDKVISLPEMEHIRSSQAGVFQ